MLEVLYNKREKVLPFDDHFMEFKLEEWKDANSDSERYIAEFCLLDKDDDPVDYQCVVLPVMNRTNAIDEFMEWKKRITTRNLRACLKKGNFHQIKD